MEFDMTQEGDNIVLTTATDRYTSHIIMTKEEFKDLLDLMQSASKEII